MGTSPHRCKEHPGANAQRSFPSHSDCPRMSAGSATAFELLAQSRASSSGEQLLLHDFSNPSKHFLGNLSNPRYI